MRRTLMRTADNDKTRRKFSSSGDCIIKLCARTSPPWRGESKNRQDSKPKSQAGFEIQEIQKRKFAYCSSWWIPTYREAVFAKVCSAAVNGIEAFAVDVEVLSGWGDTLVVIVGLP